MSTYYERRPSGAPILVVLLPLFLLLAVVVLGVFAWRLLWPHGAGGDGLNPDAQPRPVVARGNLAEIEKTNIDIYERCSPSVVHVTNLAVAQSSPFSMDVRKVPRGTGSGFIWDEGGHIVTNFHVVQGAQDVQVTLSDHSTYAAQEVWAYREKDIAVIWIDVKKKLRPIPIGTSHDLKVGQITYAIGNPFGLDQTLTTGIVSALGREITDEASDQPIQGVIQTSAAINPGNSGGPLLDSAGRLIGMNTAILSPSGTFAGIGFAVPVDDINQVVPQLIRHGKVVHPSLGVQFAPDEWARQKFEIDTGALILKVLPNSPAAQAGLRSTLRRGAHIIVGDVVVAINGQAVKDSADVQSILDKSQVGDTVTVTVVRDYGSDDQQKLDVKVQLQAGTD